MRYRVAVAAAYLALLTMFAYSSDEAMPEWIAFTVVFGVPLVVGLAAGLSGLLALPLAVLVSLGAGEGSGEIPVSFVMMFVAVVAVPEIVIGWGVRWVAIWYWRTRATLG
jgi:hypothetical protein